MKCIISAMKPNRFGWVAMTIPEIFYWNAGNGFLMVFLIHLCRRLRMKRLVNIRAAWCGQVANLNLMAENAHSPGILANPKNWKIELTPLYRGLLIPRPPPISLFYTLNSQTQMLTRMDVIRLKYALFFLYFKFIFFVVESIFWIFIILWRKITFA